MSSRAIVYALTTALIIGIGYALIRCDDRGEGDTVSQAFLNPPPSSEIVALFGSPEDMGRIQGLKLKPSIHKNVGNFWKRVDDAGYSRSKVMEFTRAREKALQASEPDTLLEIRAMAEAAALPYDDLLAYNLFPEFLLSKGSPEGECTAWVAQGTASWNGNNLFHKNRDETRDDQVVLFVAASGEDNGYKGLTTAGLTGISMGINDKGLALGNTYVDSTETNYLTGKGSLTMTKEMLQECDNIDEVFDYMDDLLSGSGAQSGSNILVVDSQQAAIIEHSAYHRSSNEDSLIVNDVGYRSNYYKVLTSYYSGIIDPRKISRYQDALNLMEARNGDLTPQDFNELSRRHIIMDEGMPSEHPDMADGSISNYHTLCAGTFEIDQDYPGILSVMWTAVGTPCTSLYTPIHNGSTEVHSAWNDSANAWNLAESIRESQDDNTFVFGSFIPHFAELEAQMMGERATVRDTAYNYLQAGQTDQALAALTNFDLAQGDSVNQEMTRLTEKKFWQDSFHYRNGIETQSNIDWHGADEEVTLAEIVAPDRIHTYDFNGATQSDPDRNIYEMDVDQFLFENDTANRNSLSEATNDDYTAIGSSDDVRWETEDPGSSDEMLLWVEIKVTEAVSDIDHLEFTFEGYSAESSDEQQAWFYFYLLKADQVGNWQDDNSWTQIVAYKEIMSGADKVFTVSLHENFSDYIATDGSITWVIGTPEGHSDQIYCDYLKMTVIEKTTSPLVYQTAGSLQSVAIDYGVNLDDYFFLAHHTLPPGTNIVYKILNSGGSELATVSAAQAAAGYSLSGMGTIAIKLQAELTSADSSVTPVLQDWEVFWSLQQCVSGACCDDSGFFRDAGYKCAEDLATAYSCQNGTNCGDDVYEQHLDQYCSGSSSICAGDTLWDGWILADDCSALEVCSEGLPVCQTAQDGDGDGLSYCEEEQYGTSDANPDTDGDGVPDGQEVFVDLTDPLDGNDFVRQVPRLINYQGRLLDDTGQPVNGSVAMSFDVYGTESGGTVLWQEGSTVEAAAGIFNVLLGGKNNIPSDLFNLETAYLKVYVNGEGLNPRQQVITHHLAMNSLRVDGALLEAGVATTTMTNASVVTVQVYFPRLYSSPPHVALSSKDFNVGGVVYVIRSVSNISEVGFTAVLESKSGVPASGTLTFTWMAHGE